MNKNIRNSLCKLSQDILEGINREAIRLRLELAGIESSLQLAAHIESLARKVCIDESTCKLLASVLPPFLESPHPEGACRNLLRYLENRTDPYSFLETLARGRPVLDIIATTFGSSQYMADIMIRNPGTIYWLIERQVWDRDDGADDYQRDLKNDISIFSTYHGKSGAMKRFHRRMLLKIGVQDLLGKNTLDETTRRLSNLADAIVAVALEIVWEDILEKAFPPGSAPPGAEDAARFEAPLAGGFAVIAMGKLGGRELNYSSDIDLIYLCEDVDEKAMAIYRTIAERLTTLLSEATEEGYLYRVDLRLRPDGETGPIVNTMESMRIYYETRGKPWEFQAYLKSRAIAGDRELGEIYLGRIESLMFNPSLPYSPVETIALLRTRIQEAISVRDRAFNIKLMEGGIRDIEFIVQTIQLLHGSPHPEIRTPTTVEAIRRIKKQGLLQAEEADSLLEAYRFFRLIEHRLQMMHQIKTHSVPETDEEIAVLARRVSAGDQGSFSKQSFLSTLTKHLNKVRMFGESFFAGTTPPETTLLLILPDSSERVASILDRFGLDNTRQALNVIHSMAYGAFPRLFDRQTRTAFERLLPMLLEAVARTGDPGLTLTTVANIASASRNEHAFYRFLHDEPGVRSLLVSLAGLSSLLSNGLCKRPDLVEPLLLDTEGLLAGSLDPLAHLRSAGSEPAAESPETLAAALADAARTRSCVEIAAFVEDLKGETFPSGIQRSLTAFARTAMETLFEHLLGADGTALFALGSYGVEEPRLKSDIDLLIAVDFTRCGAQREELIKAAQRMNCLVSDAGLFKLDFRLRGEGANAPLVQGVTFYKNYFENRIAPWEKIAFAKCRAWGGDKTLAGEFFSHLSGMLGVPLTAEELAILKTTRKKIETKVSPAHALWETKRSPGGRYDIEYLCGAAVANSLDQAAYPFSATTLKRLELTERAGFIDADDLAACRDALRLFTAVEYCMELHGFTLPHSDTRRREIERYMERTFAFLDIPIPDGIEKSLADGKRIVRRCYEKVFDRLG
jgi:glutamate-ammonia-ligase adenylyltransferase